MTRSAALAPAILFSCLLGVGLVPQLLSAQEAKPPSTPDSGLHELQQRLAEQQAATQSGNPPAVVASSRKLAALALRQMANLKMLQASGPEAIDLYKQSVTLDDSQAARVDLAVALFRGKRNAEARSQIEKVLSADPTNARAWQLKGSLQMAEEDYAAAVVSLARSLDLQTDVNAQYALGFSLLKIHQKEKAAGIFHRMLLLYGDRAIWHVVFGGAYRDTGYPEDAIPEFKRAIAIDPRVGHAHFFLGLTYLQENHWAPNPDSFRQFQEAIDLEPRNYLVNFYLGALESTTKDFARSDRHLHVAAEIEPSSPETWLYLGLNAFEQQRPSEAKTYLRKAIATTGSDEQRNNYQIRRAYFVLGRILVNEGSREEGEKMLGRVKEFQLKSLANSQDTVTATMQQEGMGTAVGVVPPLQKSATNDTVPDSEGASGPPAGNAPAPKRPSMNDTELREIDQREKQLRRILAGSFNDLGTAEARQQQYAAALSDFHQAERWDASTPGLLRNIGVAAFRQNDFAESARALNAALENSPAGQADPAVQRSRLMLAMSLFSLDKFAEADKAFTSASDSAMRDPRAAYAWAYSLAHSAQPQKANNIADTLIVDPLPPDILSLVCHIYTDTENYEHAVSCFKKAYQENPSIKRAHYEVGASLIRLDRPAEAIPELRQELTLSPDDPEVQYYLAYALLQTSRKAEAAALLQTVIAAKPNHTEAQYQLGKLLLEDGKPAEAIQHLEIAEQNEPAADYIHYQLQLAYRRAGRIADAERETKIYRDIKAQHRDIGNQHRDIGPAASARQP